MAHQCVHCGRILKEANKEILEGCANCGSKFFFFIKDENLKSRKDQDRLNLNEFSKEEKDKIEEDVRDILKIEDEQSPVILDIESIKILGQGKFEIDIVSLMNRKPVVIKLEEGKYIIDLDSIGPGKKDKLNI
jgi:predicted  nucleic acid-binding Zn-ribbon protein